MGVRWCKYPGFVACKTRGETRVVKHLVATIHVWEELGLVGHKLHRAVLSVGEILSIVSCHHLCENYIMAIIIILKLSGVLLHHPIIFSIRECWISSMLEWSTPWQQTFRTTLLVAWTIGCWGFSVQPSTPQCGLGPQHRCRGLTPFPLLSPPVLVCLWNSLP